jgi:hypothetical protein
MPDSDREKTAYAFGFMLDGARMERLQRHLLRLAAKQQGLADHPHVQELWVAVALAAVAGFAHMQVHCEGRGPDGRCPQCESIHAAGSYGQRVGLACRAEKDELAQVKRDGRLN